VDAIRSQPAAWTAPSPPAAGAGAAARAPFAPRVARRLDPGYSRFVGMMKVVLPVAAAVLIILVAVWPYLTPSDSRFRLGFSSLVASEAESPNIVNPRLVGTDEKNQPFQITADLAKNFHLRQDYWQETKPVELEMPKADVTLDDSTWLVVTANTGLLTPATKKLQLNGAVNLFHDSGYELRTSRALIDLNAGTAVSDQPVEGQGPFGTLNGEGLRIFKNSRTVVLLGKSRVVLYPETGKAAP